MQAIEESESFRESTELYFASVVSKRVEEALHKGKIIEYRKHVLENLAEGAKEALEKSPRRVA